MTDNSIKLHIEEEVIALAEIRGLLFRRKRMLRLPKPWWSTGDELVEAPSAEENTGWYTE